MAFRLPPREHLAKVIKEALGAARVRWFDEATGDEELARQWRESDFLAY